MEEKVYIHTSVHVGRHYTKIKLIYFGEYLCVTPISSETSS